MTATSHLPLVTMGDPAGVGPELACQLAKQFGPEQVAVVGVRPILERVAKQLNLPLPKHIEDIDLSASSQRMLASLAPGSFNAATGAIAWECIEAGIRLVQQQRYSSLVTNPVNKDALVAAGCPFPGHTELLGARCGERPTAMWMHGQKV